MGEAAGQCPQPLLVGADERQFDAGQRAGGRVPGGRSAGRVMSPRRAVRADQDEPEGGVQDVEHVGNRLHPAEHGHGRMPGLREPGDAQDDPRTDSAEPAAPGTFAGVGSDRCPRSRLRTSVLPAGPGWAVTDGAPLAARSPSGGDDQRYPPHCWPGSGPSSTTPGPQLAGRQPPGRCRATRHRRPLSTRRPPRSGPARTGRAGLGISCRVRQPRPRGVVAHRGPGGGALTNQ